MIRTIKTNKKFPKKQSNDNFFSCHVLPKLHQAQEPTTLFGFTLYKMDCLSNVCPFFLSHFPFPTIKTMPQSKKIKNNNKKHKQKQNNPKTVIENKQNKRPSKKNE